VQFQKISIPTPWLVIGNSEGVGISNAKNLKESMKLNSWGLRWWWWWGGEFKSKNDLLGGMDIFWHKTL